MGDHCIDLIPRDPQFRPSAAAIQEAEAYLAELCPEADEILAEIAMGVHFRDCGENFMRVLCPECAAELPMEWWEEEMDRAALPNDCFRLRETALPCGHIVRSLNELRYDWEQGFSRFVLEARNPCVEPLDPAQVARFEEILGCPLKVIYQHL